MGGVGEKCALIEIIQSSFKDKTINQEFYREVKGSGRNEGHSQGK